MNNIVDLHTLSHQIHRENILNLKSHFFVQFRYKMFVSHRSTPSAKHLHYRDAIVFRSSQ